MKNIKLMLALIFAVGILVAILIDAKISRADQPAPEPTIPCESLKKDYPDIIGDATESAIVRQPLSTAIHDLLYNRAKANCEWEMQILNTANRLDCVNFCTGSNHDQACDANYLSGPLICSVDETVTNHPPNYWYYVFQATGRATSKCRCKTPPHP